MVEIKFPIPEEHSLRIEWFKPLDNAVAPQIMAAASAPSGEFDTNNWDTVYVVSVTDVNKSIIHGMNDPKTAYMYPTSWVADLPKTTFQPAIHGEGSFGPWQIVLGGSGTILRMNVDVPQCTVSSPGVPDSLTVTHAKVPIEVYLDYLPVDSSNQNNLKLVVRTTAVGDIQAVAVSDQITYETPNPQVKGLNNILQQLLEDWFNKNLSTFQHIFTFVNINEQAANGDFQWLYPTSTKYAYIDGPTLNDAMLGVLCMTLGHDDKATVQQINAGAIPADPKAKSGFSISKNMFLSQMVLPNLPLEFPKANLSSFNLTHNGSKIENTQDIPMDAIEYLSVPYHPVVKNFSFSVNVDQIEIYTYIHIPVSPGIDAYAEITNYYGISMVEQNGEQYLTYTKLKEPDQKNWSEVETWVIVTEAIADIILAAITLGAAKLITAIERVVVRVILKILTVVLPVTIAVILEKIPEWIAGHIPAELPNISDLIENAFKSVKWTGASTFKATSISLNGALQFGGDPQFA